jgi:hypothetical protein
MPCCTLIAFVLSQLGLGTGALRVGFLKRIPVILGGELVGWKALGFAAVAAFEIVLASAALPLVVTQHGRSKANNSIHQVWHICSVRWTAFEQAALTKN